MDHAAVRVRIGLAYAGFALLGVGAGAAGVLIPEQIAHYDIDKTTIGSLFATFSAGYVASSALNGWVIHRMGVRGALLTGTGIFAASALLTGLAPAFWVLVGLQLFAGYGSGAIDAGLNAFIAAQSSATTRLNFLHAFFGVGALIGPVAAAVMLDWGIPWNGYYLLLAVLFAALLVAYRWRYPPHVDASTEAMAELSRGRLGVAIRHRSVQLTGLFLLAYVGVEVSLGNWGVSLLVEERGQDRLSASWVVSGFWLSFTIGRFSLNSAAQRVGVGPVGLTYGCLAGSVAAGLLTWFGPDAFAAGAGLVLFGFFLGPLFPTTIAVLPRLTPMHLVPTVIGVLVAFSVVGGAVFPWLAGALAQRVGVWSLLPFTLALTGLLGWCWWRIARRLGPDRSALDATAEASQPATP